VRKKIQRTTYIESTHTDYSLLSRVVITILFSLEDPSRSAEGLSFSEGLVLSGVKTGFKIRR